MKWISVKEKLPDIAKYVIVFQKIGIIRLATRQKYYNNDSWWWDINGYCFSSEDIAYWMDLPDPPEKEEKNGTSSNI